MFEHIKFDIKYTCNNQNFHTNDTNNSHFGLDINNQNNALKVKLLPKQKISNLQINATIDYDFNHNNRIFCNGYESWTDSKEFFIDDKIDRMQGVFKLTKSGIEYGDEFFVKYKKDIGCFHSFSYTYIRNNQDFCLLGSMSEINGYTIFIYNCPNNTINITKDLEGVDFDSEYLLFDIKCYNGEYNNVFDMYFADMNISKPRVEHACGYTSWYNYFTNISEQIINNDLESFAKNNQHIDIFQIDDGYQTKVGDWLSLKPVFPNGMRAISDKIHDFGAKAGIWLAPFSCTYDSQIYTNHKDWLITDHKGKPVRAGLNWHIKGFFTLDFYKPEPRKYIQTVFRTATQDWNFDMVKLDFLYSVCMTPRYNKSRGQIMCEAMDFLRECVGDKLILGCGVPLAPSFGKVDFCRTGPDVNLKWKENCLESKAHRERVSTQTGVLNTLFRRHLDNRAFVNDPDVFFLRDYNIKFSNHQKRLLATINKIFGNLLFVSDDINRYTQESAELLQKVFDNSVIKPIDVEFIDKNILSCSYELNGEYKQLVFNINNGDVLKGQLL